MSFISFFRLIFNKLSRLHLLTLLIPTDGALERSLSLALDRMLLEVEQC
jgi:hypothetical protein